MADDDNPKSHLRLAVENNQRDIDREWAKKDLRWPLRDLAANLIRVVRGAGKSYEIGRQCVAVIEALQQYREKVGYWPPSWEIDEALSIERDFEHMSSDDAIEHEYARETILRGALQVAASRLVDQRTQEMRGGSEMMDGVNSIERIREESRRRYVHAQRAQREAAKPRKGSRKKATTRKAVSGPEKVDPEN